MEPSERLEDVHELGEQLGPKIDEAKARLRDANQRIVAFIKERPGTSLLAALAIGFVIGRMVRR